jgi:F0F1-type ATP synthase delta subunit
MTPNQNSNIDQVLNLILRYAYSEAQLVKRMSVLKEFFESLYFVQNEDHTYQTTLEEISQDQEHSQMDTQLIEVIYTQYSSLFTKDSFYEVLENLKKALLTCPVIHLYIPSYLNDDSLEKIGKWLRLNLSPQIIMKISIRPELVVGCGIGWNNKYHEISFRTKIDSQKQKIISFLNSYESKTNSLS